MESSKLNSYEDLFWLPRISYLICGYEVVNSNRRRSVKLILRLFHFACFCSHVCTTIFMWRNVLKRENFATLILIFTNTLIISFAINSDIKYATSRQKSAIQRLNDELVKLYPQSTQDKKDYNVNDYNWSRFLQIVILFYYGSTAMILIRPMLQATLIYLTEHHFPYMHYYPFYIIDPEQDPLWLYFAICIVEWLNSILVVIANMSTDLWLVSFEKQICMHLDNIARLLEEYQPHHTHDVDDRKFLSQLVERHIQLVKLQEDINKIFGGSLLFSILTTGCVLCSVAIVIQIQGLTLEGVSFIIFLCTSCAQLYLICYYGEQVNISGKSIAFAAYNQNWQNATPTYKKYLLMIIIRAQRPVELSAMGYLPVTIDTFKLVLTVIYRVIAVIRRFLE